MREKVSLCRIDYGRKECHTKVNDQRTNERILFCSFSLVSFLLVFSPYTSSVLWLRCASYWRVQVLFTLTVRCVVAWTDQKSVFRLICVQEHIFHTTFCHRVSSHKRLWVWLPKDTPKRLDKGITFMFYHQREMHFVLLQKFVRRSFLCSQQTNTHLHFDITLILRMKQTKTNESSAGENKIKRNRKKKQNRTTIKYGNEEEMKWRWAKSILDLALNECANLTHSSFFFVFSAIMNSHFALARLRFTLSSRRQH